MSGRIPLAVSAIMAAPLSGSYPGFREVELGVPLGVTFEGESDDNAWKTRPWTNYSEAGSATSSVPDGGDRRMTSAVDREALGACAVQATDGSSLRLGDVWARRPAALLFLRHFG